MGQKGIISNEPCFDTRRFILTEAGWAKAHLQMENILHFINWHAVAIHRADPKVIVTSGTWNERSSTDAIIQGNSEYFNYYKDECLVKAGGLKDGILNVAQIHTYANKLGVF